MDISPSSFTAAAAFGSTYASQHQLASHVVVAFGTPMVSQRQLARHVVVAFGSVSLVAPRGAAFTVAFGTPTVVVEVPSAATISTVAGLGFARRHLDELIEAWNRLQQRREKLEAEQKLLTRQKKVIKRSRQRPVVDLTAERRLDNLIVACNRAYIMLQEREAQVYAGVQSALTTTDLDIKAISTENRRALQAIDTEYQERLQADDEDAILALM